MNLPDLTGTAALTHSASWQCSDCQEVRTKGRPATHDERSEIQSDRRHRSVRSRSTQAGVLPVSTIKPTFSLAGYRGDEREQCEEQLALTSPLRWLTV